MPPACRFFISPPAAPAAFVSRRAGAPPEDRREGRAIRPNRDDVIAPQTYVHKALPVRFASLPARHCSRRMPQRAVPEHENPIQQPEMAAQPRKMAMPAAA
jgi:hypothetical protein